MMPQGITKDLARAISHKDEPASLTDAGVMVATKKWDDHDPWKTNNGGEGGECQEQGAWLDAHNKKQKGCEGIYMARHDMTWHDSS